MARWGSAGNQGVDIRERLLPAPARLPAARPQLQVRVRGLAVLAGHLHLRLRGEGAEVFAVLDQALLAAGELDRELRDRRVGHVQEPGPDPGGFLAGLDRVDEADQGDVDLAV